MKKRDCIKKIKELFPPDTDRGRQLLLDSVIIGWEKLPIKYLSNYLNICEIEKAVIEFDNLFFEETQ